MRITEDISIEELVETLPDSVYYLAKKKIQCIICGEPIWGTLKEVAESKGFTAEDIEQFVEDLNNMAGRIK